MVHVNRCVSIALVFALLFGITVFPSTLFADELGDSLSVDYATGNRPAAEEDQSTAIPSDGDTESSQPEPEYNVSPDSAANSFRFTNGYLIDGADTEGSPGNAGISTLSIDFSKGGNYWTRNGDTYSATGTDGSSGMTVTGAKGFGIDVSSWQNDINWAAVKSSGIVDYAIIRCGRGDDMRSQDDRQFINNVNGCQKNGIPFGIYIYSYAYNTSMAQSEANHVLRLLKEAGLDPSKVAYPIYLDLEQQDQSGRPAGMNDGKYHTVSNQMLEQIAITFCSSIESAGYEAGIYANRNWWTNYLVGSSFNEWSKWVAQYNTSCTYSGSYDMWQCMSNGRISGIDGNVDINFDFVGLDELVQDPNSSSNSLVVYRLYNPVTGEHLYSPDVNERNVLVRNGWNYENIAWYAPKKSSTPVYRLFNRNNGDHHYTTSKQERDTLVKIGWTYENICGYSDDSEGVPLYRVFNPNQMGPGAHHFTASVDELASLIKLGWMGEGTAWYGMAQ